MLPFPRRFLPPPVWQIAGYFVINGQLDSPFAATVQRRGAISLELGVPIRGLSFLNVSSDQRPGELQQTHLHRLIATGLVSAPQTFAVFFFFFLNNTPVFAPINSVWTDACVSRVSYQSTAVFSKPRLWFSVWKLSAGLSQLCVVVCVTCFITVCRHWSVNSAIETEA